MCFPIPHAEPISYVHGGPYIHTHMDHHARSYLALHEELGNTFCDIKQLDCVRVVKLLDVVRVVTLNNTLTYIMGQED